MARHDPEPTASPQDCLPQSRHSIEKMKSCHQAYRSVQDAPVRDDFAIRQFAVAMIDS
jgi:hypothetical protein